MAGRQNYNRYNEFLLNGEQTIVPHVSLPSKSTDKKYIYKLGQTRMDKISQQYYGTPTFGWLILAANPIFGGIEWNIPDAAILTIPYPLINSLQDYKNSLENHFFYYGR
jgi:hypothetical protein